MRSDKLKLILLVLMTALPIVAATVLFKLQENGGLDATTNNGTLIVPVLDITALDMRGAAGEALFRSFEEAVAGVDPEEYEARPWLLVYLGGTECGPDCEERLYFLRQLHRRLSADAPRVQRYYLSATLESPGDAGALAPDTRALFGRLFPEMEVAWADPETIRRNLARTVENAADPVTEHYIYVVDPVGNVMLYFTPDNTPEQILEDIDKLLERSSLG